MSNNQFNFHQNLFNGTKVISSHNKITVCILYEDSYTKFSEESNCDIYFCEKYHFVFEERKFIKDHFEKLRRFQNLVGGYSPSSEIYRLNKIYNNKREKCIKN